MKLLFATFLVVIAMTTAEPPRFRSHARQTGGAAPYQPQGYRPAGAPFALPQQAYGPPQEYGPSGTSTEAPVTEEAETEEYPTEQPQFERFLDGKAKSEKLRADVENLDEVEENRGKAAEPEKPVFVVLPGQNYFYALQRGPLLPRTALLPSSKYTQALPRAHIIPNPFFAPYTSAPLVQIYQ